MNVNTRSARGVWYRLLGKALFLHHRLAEIDFLKHSRKVRPRDIEPHLVPATDLFLAEKGLGTDADHAGFRDAALAVARMAHWRETYKDTDIGQDFLDRFGCFELVGGENAPFQAEDDYRSFVVYMPAGLHYPWHHHPAEEAYVVIAGEAEFALKDEDTETLGPGDIVQHPSMRPHAITTREHPLLAYVVWRPAPDDGEDYGPNRGLGVSPVLSGSESGT